LRPQRSLGNCIDAFGHLRGICSCQCGATEHLDRTGHTKDIARGGAMPPGGLTDEGTTAVATFEVRIVALLGDGADAAQH
jgi:hypothetical protein